MASVTMYLSGKEHSFLAIDSYEIRVYDENKTFIGNISETELVSLAVGAFKPDKEPSPIIEA